MKNSVDKVDLKLGVISTLITPITVW